MPIEVLMPALSPTMKSGTIRKWYKAEGDVVKSGDVIADIETDKAVMEFEYTDEDGIMGKIFFAEGSKNIEVNQLIALIAVDEQDLAKVHSYEKGDNVVKNELVALQDSQPAQDESVVLQMNQQIVNASEVLVNSSNSSERVKVSPLAKKIASNLGVDVNLVKGTGPYGRIIKADILDVINQHGHIANSPEDASFTEISSMRRVIAERLVYSKQTIPHFYVSIDCLVDSLLKLRLEINAENPDTKVTVNDFIIKAVAMSIKKFPEINVSWSDDKIVVFPSIDISVAVSIDNGLITPIIFGADKKSLLEISREVKALASKAKSGKLKPEEFQGGGFTVSNLGMFGIKEFYAIVNPPQSCIMSVGCSEKRAMVVNEQICISNVVTVTLSVDHRVIDGVLAAKFLNCFKSYLEKPFLMLI
ncbi:pyruvate dehydrogenase complex dihydrolipoamide acetyltransferase [Ehrlichia chaffeensis str. Heartland]|uniref:pyruvate dehydrogenase complex dihydrolipoamide acetyltransferase n=1 Tax=Ehrlichia chaffeensis TaxID=945 RepID=UPI000053CE69|nr:pyruvate dehydrogenase complex dihydrolipoamide acetyltransferase [Ehrlichia chaffeensis]AHX04095.1 pyruvate dehydrogenase complex dihydrolipoamide acetyltransferase [Ehrlichia chaffeensis str. Heartland]AHX06031.1 pyruvate dehydrogenase complex dihydrolipoamide acetyltransferase [Ehrlichia chaffeensis str. Jax]AHX07021.1 pyruvate dehydrogenase complex dihydrolipoamide acetyltransferase [Ehrlichia chaffeensis str. Liberty]AHX07313.1 pyruvate dehydrogenase complex dihydrolipoamide acetyltrans